MLIYAQTHGELSTNSGTFTPIPGLSVKLPRGVQVSALLILNIPNPYARGNDFPGGTFGLRIESTMAAPVAVFTYNEQVPQSAGRVPTTLSLVVPLNDAHETTVTAMWSGVRGSTVIVDTPTTLTAIIG
jgi:hypothetical protein